MKTTSLVWPHISVIAQFTLFGTYVPQSPCCFVPLGECGQHYTTAYSYSKSQIYKQYTHQLLTTLTTKHRSPIITLTHVVTITVVNCCSHAPMFHHPPSLPPPLLTVCLPGSGPSQDCFSVLLQLTRRTC